LIEKEISPALYNIADLEYRRTDSIFLRSTETHNRIKEVKEYVFLTQFVFTSISILIDITLSMKGHR